MDQVLQQITIKFILLAIVLIFTEAKPLTKSLLSESTKNQDLPKVSDLMLLWKKVHNKHEIEKTIDTTSFSMKNEKLQGLKRFKRTSNPQDVSSLIMNSLCARAVPAESSWTNGESPGDILESRDQNLMTVYTPCLDDNQFFDGWGG